MISTYSSDRVTALEPHEVFVFCSNASGFHGAGSAGFAYTGKPGNQYRAGNPDLRQPNGHLGHWARLGHARGFQRGRRGRSYAIQTVTKPGALRSITLQEIRRQAQQLADFAKARPRLRFLLADFTHGSFNGYSAEEMASAYEPLLACRNVAFSFSSARLMTDVHY